MNSLGVTITVDVETAKYEHISVGWCEGRELAAFRRNAANHSGELAPSKANSVK